MRIGLYEKAISNQFSWEEKILLAKTAGYAFLEISIDETDEKIARLDWTEQQFQEMNVLLDKHDFKIQSLCLSAHRKFPLGSCDDMLVEQSFLILKKALLFASKLGIKYIQLAGYDVYYEQSNSSTIKQFSNNLIKITELAAEAKIVLAIETMDTKFIGTCKQALKYIQPLPVNLQNYLQIYPDIGNTYQWLKTQDVRISMQHFARDFIAGFDYISQIHIKQTKTNTFRDLFWTDGDVAFVAIFQLLKKLNYQKDFVIEMWAHKNKDYSYNEQLQVLVFALKFIQNQMQQAGW